MRKHRQNGSDRPGRIYTSYQELPVSEEVIFSPDDPLHQYYYGSKQFHTGEINEATGTFKVYMTICEEEFPECAGTYENVMEPVSIEIYIPGLE